MCRTSILNAAIALILILAGCADPRDERTESADVLFERAVQYMERGWYEEAAAAFQNLIEVDRDIGRLRRVAEHELYLGIIAEREGRFDDARNWYTRSSETSRRAASHEGIVTGMIRVARLEGNLGHTREEYSEYHRALTYTRFFNYPRGEASIHLHLGDYETRNGRIEYAYHHYSSAVQIAGNENDPALQYKTLIALAENYVNQGNYTQASNRIEEAQQYEKYVDDPIEQIQFVLTSGKIFEEANRYSDALSLYEKGWNNYRERPRNDEYFLRLLEALADAYLIHGRYRDALGYYDVLIDLARNYDRQIAYGYAMLGKSDALLKLGIVREEDDFVQQAVQLARETEAHFGHQHYFTGQAYAVFQQARSLSLLGRSEESIRLYKNALQYLSETLTPEGVFFSQKRFEQRNNFSSPHTAITDFLVNELMQAGRYEEAFLYTERERQNTLNNAVLRIGFDAADRNSSALADSLTHLYRKIRSLDFTRLNAYERSTLFTAQQDTLRTLITLTRNNIENIQNKLTDSLPNSKRIFDRDVPPGNTYRQALLSDRTLVSYYATHTHLHTFVLTRGSLRVHSQELPREILNERTNTFQRLISSPQLLVSEDSEIDGNLQKDYERESQWIYDTFIRPVLTLRSDLQHGIFVMPAGLHDLPLHALKEPGGRRDFIIQKFHISYLPSATVLTFQLENPRRVSSIAAFGNPDGNDWQIDYEIRDIRGIYRDARLYLESNASINNLKSEKGDILHLTSEFFYQPRFPEQSHFYLTETGSITVRQFGLQHLTGLHQFPHIILYNSGDIVEGLNILHPYLFYVNGCRSIIVNFWSREPRSGKWFNENIYSNLSIEHSLLGAFHEAQKTLISTPEYSHPHFWASFFIFSP
jgi:tetratricopeptide (TPR) repeat protein